MKRDFKVGARRVAFGPRGIRGFTLIELLAVMVIIALIFVLSGSALQSSMQSTQLVSTSTTFGNDLQLGVQLAVKENRPVELRFYKLPLPEDGIEEAQFRAYQFVARNLTSGTVEELEPIRRLSGGIILHPSPSLSTVFSIGEKTSNAGDPSLVPEGETYQYVRFQFRPDGSTTLPKDGLWSLTFAFEQDVEESATEVPTNFRSVTINAFNGTGLVY